MSIFFSRITRYISCRLVYLLVLFGVNDSCFAQGLKDLYELARVYDATYLAARGLISSTRYSLEQSQALRWPSVGLTASAGYESISSGQVDSINGNTYQTNIEVEQWLFNRGNSVTIAQAEKLPIVAQADLQIADQDLIVRLAQAYFDVLAAQDAQSTVQANKKVISEQLNLAKRKFDAGSATVTDSREAQARYDIVVAQEMAVDNDSRLKHIELDQLVGRNAVVPQALKVSALLPGFVSMGLDEWIRFVDTAPEVRKAQLAYEVAKLETQKAGLAGWPTLKLIGSVGVIRSNQVVDTLSPTRKFFQGSVAMALQMPLYSGGAIGSRQKETVALEDQALKALDAVRRLAAAKARQAFFAVQSGHAQVKALDAAESSSNLAVEATKVGYRVGVRVSLDVLNAQTQLFTTQRDLARARYDVILNNLKLRQATGMLTANDVDAISALLLK